MIVLRVKKKIRIWAAVLLAVSVIIVLIYLYYPTFLYYIGKVININFFSIEEIPQVNIPAITYHKSSKLTNNEIYAEKTDVEEFTIKIPKIGVDAEILSGTEESILEKGIWHLISSATPDQKGGNVVILGHRWKYKPPDPRTFYLLDKLEINDEILLNYNKHLYRYKVIEQKIVDHGDVGVIRQTGKDEITLITCTPIYTTLKRLVVVAKLTKPEK